MQHYSWQNVEMLCQNASKNMSESMKKQVKIDMLVQCAKTFKNIIKLQYKRDFNGIGGVEIHVKSMKISVKINLV